METVEKMNTERTLTNSKQDGKLKKLCFELFKLKLSEQKAKEDYAKAQAEVKAYFAKSKEKSLSFSVGKKSYKVTDVNQKMFVWDSEKLYDKLIDEGMDKEKVKSFISTEVVINDWNGFAEFLKSKGIKAKEVLDFITINRKVDTKKVNQLSEIGEITEKDIEGCYELKDKAGYVTLTEWENEDEES